MGNAAILWDREIVWGDRFHDVIQLDQRNVRDPYSPIRLYPRIHVMKIFHCNHCDQLVYFENTSCVNCGSLLAFLPDRREICSLENSGTGTWRHPGELKAHYRLCANYTQHNVCNWAVDVDDPDPYCRSCRLNQTIPDLRVEGNRVAWAKLELAKRRVVYSLEALKLPVVSKKYDTRGLFFEFLADNPGVPVLTGHDEGLIILNIAEADDSEREKRRHSLHEPYRTILGHFRHEVGHYYWDRLIRDTDRLPAFRAIFGDESVNYDEALKIHYAQGAPANWQESYISSYSTTHPWEDWAESWAHYLHMTDTLETASASGLSLRPRRSGEPSLSQSDFSLGSFDQMIANWFPLTHVLNNLNRGLGLPDGYPFIISPPVIEKLRFIHETIIRFRPERRLSDQFEMNVHS
jgi:hypothetical protein